MSILVRLGFLVAVLAVPLAHATNLFAQTELPKRVVAAGATWMAALLWTLVSRRGVTVHGARFLVLVLAFVAWQLAILPFAYRPSQGVTTVLATIESAGWLLLALQALAGRGMRDLTIVATGLAAVVASAVGLLQYAVAHPAAFPFAGEAAREFVETWRRGDVLGGLFADLRQTDLPGSAFGHTNVAAEFVAAAMALVGGWAWFSRERRGVGRIARFATAAVIVIVGGLFVVRSGSRGALLALAGVGGVVWFAEVVRGFRERPWFGSRPAHLLAHGLLILAVVGLVGVAADHVRTQPRHGQVAVSAWDRLASGFDRRSTTVRERLDLWGNTSRMVSHHPVFGVGPGNFEVVYPEYGAVVRRHETGRLTLRRQPKKPHNEYLNAAAENGLLGALLQALPILVALGIGMRVLFGSRSRRDPRPFAAAATLALVAILIVAFVAFPFEGTATRTLFWTAVAMIVSQTKSSRAPVVAGWPLRLVLAGVFGAMIAIGAGHYRARLRASESFERSHAAGTLIERLRHCDQAVARVPTDVRYRLRRGELLRLMNRPTEALAAFDRVLERQPNLINAEVGRAGVYLSIERPDEAERAARRALHLNASIPEAYLVLADALLAKGRDDAAREAYERALTLRPEGPTRLRAYVSLARMFSEAGDVLAARYHLGRAKVLAPDHLATLDAEARIFEREAPGAAPTVAAWARLVAANPRHAEARLRLGIARIDDVGHSPSGLPKAREALALVSAAYELDPRLVEALYYRGMLLARTGDLLGGRNCLLACMQECGKHRARMDLWDRCRTGVQDIERQLAAATSKQVPK